MIRRWRQQLAARLLAHEIATESARAFGSGWCAGAHVRTGMMLRILVELDGHDFHEKTKEQVTYRNQRDRDLQMEGWKVLHYSGSELHRNPVQAAQDAYNVASADWLAIKTELRSARQRALAEIESKRGSGA